MKELVSVYINGKKYEAEKGEMLINVARRNGIKIPSLCYEEFLEPYGSCRICIVEVKEGARPGITTSCSLACVEGLKVETDTPEIIRHRKMLIELYLAQAPEAEKIKELAKEYGVKSTRFKKKYKKDDPLNNKCILCGLCVRVCNEVMGYGAINFINRGHKTKVNTPYFEPSNVCSGCKACVEICPTDAITVKEEGNKRIFVSWSNTTVELEKCEECGKYFASEKLVSRVLTKVYPNALHFDDTFKKLCQECKRKYMLLHNITELRRGLENGR
ncbi:2Fe-2S iron-sulfur cluster-binding protein [Desulfurobacterium thermolithotrophum]|uniref:2Fe-2S iron-sulfur cluster-binding protein n=1 Tax=Desulfurobacterium thermolithotrophum TaxID=64160 RepID=UPI0013D7FC50|nr:2Fe-2S iron-sulfur cluster-binding protein [Desulfurobacterium thermolithotrophum]